MRDEEVGIQLDHFVYRAEDGIHGEMNASDLGGRAA
jgi:hypothetical protein